MTKKEYVEYLGNLVDMDLDVDRNDLSDQLYGFFQCFMPDGKDLKKVFEPLGMGDELYSRLVPIYQVTGENVKQLMSEDLSPAYFCPPPVAASDKLCETGKQYLENLKEFLVFIQDQELVDMLNNITDVVIKDQEPDWDDSEINEYLYDVISDWGISNMDEDNLISVLREAYYSINCDYYLSYYFQYPAMKNKPEIDFLEPYFKIWQSGYYCKFTDTQLVLYK